MDSDFKIEIISPEKIIFSDKAELVKIPSYEGEMGILKNHISIITFLRPGIVKVEKKNGSSEEFFVEDGTIEFFNNVLVLLSASAENIKNLSKEYLENLSKDTQDKLKQENIADEDRYVLNYKLDALKAIRT